MVVDCMARIAGLGSGFSGSGASGKSSASGFFLTYSVSFALKFSILRL